MYADGSCFSSFLFAVGNSMAFTQPGLVKIFRRTVLLFLIGWLLTWYPFKEHLRETRIMAVLQRIALAYCLAALIVNLLMKRGRWRWRPVCC